MQLQSLAKPLTCFPRFVYNCYFLMCALCWPVSIEVIVPLISSYFLPKSLKDVVTHVDHTWQWPSILDKKCVPMIQFVYCLLWYLLSRRSLMSKWMNFSRTLQFSSGVAHHRMLNGYMFCSCRALQSFACLQLKYHVILRYIFMLAMELYKSLCAKRTWASLYYLNTMLGVF